MTKKCKLSTLVVARPVCFRQMKLKPSSKKLRQHYNIHPEVEITLEGNPDDLTKEKLISLLRWASTV